MKKQLPLFIIIVLVIAGGSFYGGMVYGKSQAGSRSANGNQFQQFRNAANGDATVGPNGQGLRRPAGPGGIGGFTVGEILSKDDKSITVKLRDGGSKIVFYTDTTTVSKMTDGILSDLEIGKEITVTGSANADGSVSAQSIQIRPLPPVSTATTTPSRP